MGPSMDRQTVGYEWGISDLQSMVQVVVSSNEHYPWIRSILETGGVGNNLGIAEIAE